MGLIALPVSKAGLSVLLGQLGQDEPDESEAASEAPVDMSALQAKIRQMQAFLSVPQTGELDDTTRANLKSFQWARGLEETGFPDAATIKELQAVVAELQSLTTWERARLYVYAHKWWFVGGAAVLVGGGLLIRSARRRR